MEIEKMIYTVCEIKQMLGIGENLAYKLVKSGAFPVKTIGRRIVVSKEIFQAWLNDNFSSYETAKQTFL